MNQLKLTMAALALSMGGLAQATTFPAESFPLLMSPVISVEALDAASALTRAAPTISAEVAQRALDAVACALEDGHQVDKLVVVDMSLPAKSKRLWAFDMTNEVEPKLLLNERVAHGSGSDPRAQGRAETFSNRPNSHMTSLGLYKISERYQGKHGISRRLDGLFARFNGKARERAIVLHPSNYVREDHVGRSQGCPAVNQRTMDELERQGLANAVLWMDGPDQDLAVEVAECARKREMRQVAEAAAVREAELGFTRVLATWTGASPWFTQTTDAAFCFAPGRQGS